MMPAASERIIFS
ncbi:hypothetical protein YPPY58_2912, partial [Yersinia pestis PY-58]